MTPYLRKATEADTETLFRWRNDPETRENSFQTQPIPYEEHVAWINKALHDASQEIYILCEGTVPIGQVRLSTEGNTSTVSYSIDADYRAQGYGRVMLQLAENLCAERGAPDVLRGYVKTRNIASQLIFEKLGYVRTEASEEDCLLYVKRNLQYTMIQKEGVDCNP